MKMLPKNSSIGSNFKIEFKDVDITNLTQEQMRQIRGDTISMIFQEPLTSLNPLHRIGSQLIEVLREHNKIDKITAKERALELLKEVQILSQKKIKSISASVIRSKTKSYDCNGYCK